MGIGVELAQVLAQHCLVAGGRRGALEFQQDDPDVEVVDASDGGRFGADAAGGEAVAQAGGEHGGTPLEAVEVAVFEGDAD